MLDFRAFTYWEVQMKLRHTNQSLLFIFSALLSTAQASAVQVHNSTDPNASLGISREVELALALFGLLALTLLASCVCTLTESTSGYRQSGGISRLTGGRSDNGIIFGRPDLGHRRVASQTITARDERELGAWRRAVPNADSSQTILAKSSS